MILGAACVWHWMCSILYSVLCQPVHMWACIYEHDGDLLIQLSYMWRFKSLVLEFRCYMWSDTHTSISDAHVLVQEASKPVAKLLLRIHSKTPCSSASSLHHLSMCSDKKRKSITNLRHWVCINTYFKSCGYVAWIKDNRIRLCVLSDWRGKVSWKGVWTFDG